MTPAQLAHIHAASFTTPRPWTQIEFEQILIDPSMFLVTSPYGFAIGRKILDEAELLTIAISPEHQGKGHGQQLLEAFELQSKQLDLTRLLLEVAESNQRAIELYQKSGFYQIAQRKDYYQSPKGQKVTALIFEKPI